jgi:hypothetical protein
MLSDNRELLSFRVSRRGEAGRGVNEHLSSTPNSAKGRHNTRRFLFVAPFLTVLAYLEFAGRLSASVVDTVYLFQNFAEQNRNTRHHDSTGVQFTWLAADGLFAVIICMRRNGSDGD